MSLFEQLNIKRLSLHEVKDDTTGRRKNIKVNIQDLQKKIWIEGKIQMEMASVDEQVKEIHKEWDGYTQPRVKYVETDSEVKGLKDMSIEAYREAAAADAWLFGDYDAYESYDINTKKVSEEDESV